MNIHNELCFNSPTLTPNLFVVYIYKCIEIKRFGKKKCYFYLPFFFILTSSFNKT